MRFTVRHAYAMSSDDFWSRMFFDDAFNAELYEKALNFEKYEIVERIEPGDGQLIRSARIVPRLEIPAPIRRLLGGRVWYFERGRFDPESQSWETLLEVPALGDKLDVRTRMHLQPRVGGGSDRVLDVRISTRIFGIGKLVEGFLERAMRDSYRKAADFTNAWWAEHGDEVGISERPLRISSAADATNDEPSDSES